MAAHSHTNSAVQAPSHPVPQLQGPFEESMLESVQDDPDADIYLDPIVRRNTLLEAPVYTRVVAGRWKQKPGERYHPLWKLIAQISFGIHLLAQGMAKSEDEVMQILQAHVDEIDGFLERTTEDFDLAQDDIQERLRCLKLPLSHPATFDKMLEDRNFRLSIVEGNEKIEHIVDRTTQAMKDSIKDVQKGLDSTGCLETYLRQLDAVWIRQCIEHEAVFVAMLGNVEGWRKAFQSLLSQGTKLNGSLKKLTDIINEMQARAGEVSRRLLHQARGYPPGVDPHYRQSQSTGRSAPGRTTPTSRFQTLPSKQLPGMPERPSLRQAVSDDSVRSQSSMRANSSQDNLRRRLATPSPDLQGGIPTARQVRSGPSPKVIQIGPTSSGRVQSIVPSLVDTPSPRGTPIATEDDEQPDRYFPPVELPAHVPEETMRMAPISKQNRLSLGLGLAQSKRASRLGLPAAALVDLLRKPSSQRSSTAMSQTQTESPGPSRRFSTIDSNPIIEESVDSTKHISAARPTPAIENAGSNFSKTNVRRPKKGAQHWFDAHEDEFDDDDKYSIQDDATPQVTTMTKSIVVKPVNFHDNLPGTPSWAVKSFAQADERRAELKKGAFGSHPPTLPPGSPPLGQENKMPDPLAVVAPERSLSHASSAGTLGEPGPAVTPSEAGSIKVRPGHPSEDSKWKRSSTAAPEAVTMEKVPPMPTPPKQFCAEMEGSVPVHNGKASRSAAGAVMMELEAPQQYFKLPPRPQPAPSTKSPARQEFELEGGEVVLPHQQYFKLPSRESAVRVSTLPPAPYQEGGKQQNDDIESGSTADKQQDKKIESLKEERVEPSVKTEQQPIEVIIERTTAEESKEVPEEAQTIKTTVAEWHESTEATRQAGYLATPQIPLPASPLEEAVMESSEQEEQEKVDEALFLLPAVAYKAPISARPSLEPLRTQLQAHTYTPQEVKTPSQTTPVPEDEAVPAQDSSSSKSLDEPTRPSPIVKEPEAVEGPSMNSTRKMQRDHKPSELKHTRNMSSHGSQNGWKAFFTGQPSPVGSNLSIRSIQRESVLEPRSPALLSPGSATTRFPASPIASSAKDVVWFNKPFDDVKPGNKGTSSLAADKTEGGEGLGISVLAASDMKKRAVSAS